MAKGPGGFISDGLQPLKAPDAPTSVVATNAGLTSISVAFSAPSNVGGSAITSYVAIATDSSSGAQFTGTAASSPVTISGLTTGNTYTCRVFAVNIFGPSAYSAVSNSAVPAVVQGQQEYITAGTYSFVVPAGVTSISTLCVGGGGSGFGGGGGGGGLSYRNNISVTSGETLTVDAGAGATGTEFTGGESSIKRSSTYLNLAKGGGRGSSGGFGGSLADAQGAVPSVLGGSGGRGDPDNTGQNGGGGAGGYSGDGGDGGTSSRTAGSGGGGGGGSNNFAGGGVGLLGEGSSGSSGGSGAGNPGSGGSGKLYGGGGGQSSGAEISGQGAVRIIWPGNTRSYPSTNTGNV